MFDPTQKIKKPRRKSICKISKSIQALIRSETFSPDTIYMYKTCMSLHIKTFMWQSGIEPEPSGRVSRVRISCETKKLPYEKTIGCPSGLRGAIQARMA